MNLSKTIINWYLANKRELPWRETNDPYVIWISEVILQQTRVEQGLPYFRKFIETYPTLKDLAKAGSRSVKKIWQGLGYYNRAENLLSTAKAIVKERKGVFPQTYNQMLTLKGIGPYTAAAVSSFAFNQPMAAVDGNVSRVIARLFAVKEAVNSTKGKKTVQEIADELLDKKDPGLFNQAMMELGAMICKPSGPLCGQCPVRLQCEAFKKKAVERFPVKIKKKKPADRYIYYFLFHQNKKIFITKRTGTAIWKGLYELPNIESGEAIRSKHITSSKEFKKQFGKIYQPKQRLVYSTKHQLSHLTIHAFFFEISSDKKIEIAGEKFICTGFNRITGYPVSRLFDKFLNYYNLQSNP
ncbi:MAG: A/G-specific adenine glycosylase [Bacteroidia bacterium]